MNYESKINGGQSRTFSLESMVLNYLRHRHSVWKSVYYDIDAKIVESENNQIKDTNARWILSSKIPFWALRNPIKFLPWRLRYGFYRFGLFFVGSVLDFWISFLLFSTSMPKNPPLTLHYIQIICLADPRTALVQLNHIKVAGEASLNRFYELKPFPEVVISVFSRLLPWLSL